MKTETLKVKREWYENGKLYCEEYWLNGKHHNTEGPAYRYWYDNGKLRYESYWLKGKELSKEEWEKQRKTNSCNGKVIEIDGKKYQLKEI